ncbi:MAG: PIN domain-containing protein [Myxococcales bacterium]
MIVYVETSALLRYLLDRDESIAPHLEKAELVTSRLTIVEAGRAFARLRQEGRREVAALNESRRGLEAFLSACEIAALSDEILLRAAAPFPVEPLRTLDAIHVATAAAWNAAAGSTAVLSTDDRVRDNAKALGLEVLPH